MCGIAGIVRFDDCPVDPSRARSMLAHLQHRGPDAAQIQPHGRCTLVHARLSIIDILGGGQPMRLPQSADRGPLTVVSNGMIYNHRVLRSELEGLGHQFASDHSDTEVLLHGFRQWGTELPARLSGFFAFAIWDEQEESLFLCRDRYGKKPLYVCRGENELSFASLVGTLVAGAESTHSFRLNPQSLTCFLRFGYTFTDSLLETIEEVPLGHWMIVDRVGNTVAQSYWRMPLNAPDAPRKVDSEPIMAHLEQAVAERLEADVPLGCFLSGGIDSSCVAALAQRQLMRGNGNRGERLQTFSVSMADIDYDEGPHAQQVAQHIGSQHHCLVAAPSATPLDDLDRLTAMSGEPTADSSLLATFWLSQTAREHVKVVLSGDGGDELFAGYDRYRALHLLRKHGWWMRCISPNLCSADHTRPHAQRTRIHRLLDAAKFKDSAQQYHSMIHLFNEPQIQELGIDVPPTDSVPKWTAHANPPAAARQWDLHHYLPFDLLRKVDRASMAVALEVRCPFLDIALAEAVGPLPVHALMPKNQPKGLLRNLARNLLPPQIITRPKRGFAIPLGRWFRQQLRAPTAERLFDGSLEQIGLRRRVIERLFEQHLQETADHTHRLFALVSLVAWVRWLKGLR